MKYSRVLLILVWCFLTVPMFAYGAEIPPGRWWKRPMVINELKLSSEQNRRLDEAFLGSRKKWIDLKGNVDKARLEMESLFERREYNEQELMEQFKRMDDAQRRLSEARFVFVLAVRKILTYEQFQRLMQLFQEYKRKEINERRIRKPLGPLEPPNPRPHGAQ